MQFIVNPTAGGGRARRAARAIERRLSRAGVDFRLAETAGRGDALDLAREAARAGADAVVAVGGDGTVHEIVNGLLRAREEQVPLPPFGVVPAGSGNDFVTSAAGTSDALALYNALRGGALRSVDAGRVEWPGGHAYFVNAMGLGIDVEVVRQVERSPRLPGLAGYLLALARALVGFSAVPVRLRVDGEEWRGRVMMAAVSNGARLGGGFRLSPDARIDDGHLDLCIVSRLGAWGVARAVPRILAGTHGTMAAVTMRKGTMIEIERTDGASLVLQLDGELCDVGPAALTRVAALPGALRLIVPAAEGAA